MKSSKYVSKKPDAKGFVNYTDEEHGVWQTLYERQMKIIQGRACEEYLQGINTLGMKAEKIPQLPVINECLMDTTGWQVAAVPALISFDKFFELLANKKFPAATFIRRPEELEYLQEPDIFHEIFGHCPLLTNQAYADFTETYGKIGLKASKKDRVMLARLYWFTIEFGLIQKPEGLRIYGGGILSSIGETVYALESDVPVRKILDPVDALRTPYRIDIFQTVYFIIKSFDELYQIAHSDVMSKVKEAKKLGMHEPTFPPKDGEVESAC